MKKKNSLPAGRQGFTLIEILVTVTIIGILMGLVLVSYQGARKSARDGKRKADLEQVRSALEMCRADTGSYPVGTLISNQDISCAGTVYMKIPADSLADRRYVYTRLTANSYNLCAALEVGGTAGSCGTINCGSAGSVSCDYKVTNP